MSFNVPNSKYKDKFQPTLGQTVFILGAMPSERSLAQRFINGVESTDELKINGTTMTYIGTNFILTPEDSITVYYE